MTAPRNRPTALAIWLIIAGVVGLIAAFALTLDRIYLSENPGASASCDFSVLLQCSANIKSWQGSVFGFPNPLIGLMAWPAPIVVGVALLGGVRFPRWFWITFWAGITGAFVFVCWLISQSIFALGTLCPWCMATWSVTIPTFYAVTLHLFRSGVFPVSARSQATAAPLMKWVPLAAVVSYAIILLLAQLRLDALTNIINTLFG